LSSIGENNFAKKYLMVQFKSPNPKADICKLILNI